MRFTTVAGIMTVVLAGTCAQARDYISIAGSSTVLPFATIIAEQLGNNPSFKTPIVESGGSSVGKKGVCEGTGTEFTDIGNASSRMKIGELEFCDKNGVTVTEITDRALLALLPGSLDFFLARLPGSFNFLIGSRINERERD